MYRTHLAGIQIAGNYRVAPGDSDNTGVLLQWLVCPLQGFGDVDGRPGCASLLGLRILSGLSLIIALR
jgi:hypothetical protein